MLGEKRVLLAATVGGAILIQCATSTFSLTHSHSDNKNLNLYKTCVHQSSVESETSPSSKTVTFLERASAKCHKTCGTCGYARRERLKLPFCLVITRQNAVFDSFPLLPRVKELSNN